MNSVIAGTYDLFSSSLILPIEDSWITAQGSLDPPKVIATESNLMTAMNYKDNEKQKTY